jgi:hypothetical protein
MRIPGCVGGWVEWAKGRRSGWQRQVRAVRGADAVPFLHARMCNPDRSRGNWTMQSAKTPGGPGRQHTSPALGILLCYSTLLRSSRNQIPRISTVAACSARHLCPSKPYSFCYPHPAPPRACLQQVERAAHVSLPQPNQCLQPAVLHLDPAGACQPINTQSPPALHICSQDPPALPTEPAAGCHRHLWAPRCCQAAARRLSFSVAGKPQPIPKLLSMQEVCPPASQGCWL